MEVNTWWMAQRRTCERDAGGKVAIKCCGGSHLPAHRSPLTFVILVSSFVILAPPSHLKPYARSLWVPLLPRGASSPCPATHTAALRATPHGPGCDMPRCTAAP